jgi:hypothetical protein
VNRDLEGAVAKRRPALDLNRNPTAVVEPVDQSVDAAIEQRQENVQTPL